MNSAPAGQTQGTNSQKTGQKKEPGNESARKSNKAIHTDQAWKYYVVSNIANPSFRLVLG